MNRLLFLSCLGLLTIPQLGHAQSGSSSSTRPQLPRPGTAVVTPRGSGNVMRETKVAMDGYCPVCLAKGKGWVAGNPQFQTAYDGLVYRFPNPEALAAFQADPTKFVPVLAGDDVVAFVRTGQRVAGKMAFGAKYLERFYFFANEANKQAFSANPAQYANADLAAGGACAVCRVDMNRNMSGNPEISTTHNGMRYQFVGLQQREAFLANPSRYTAASATPHGSGSSFRSAPQTGSGSGRR